MIHIDGVKDNMIANNVDPFEPTHPGEVIRDELEDRGMSQRQLAKKWVCPILFSTTLSTANVT